MAFPPIPILRRKSVRFFVGVAIRLGHFVPQSGIGRGTGLSYTPYLLMKPVLRLRLHATQSQPCFPAVKMPLPSPAATAISQQRRQSV